MHGRKRTIIFRESRKKFIPRRELFFHWANCFLKDAHDYNVRLSLMWHSEDMIRWEFKAKYLVDILLLLECSLKALFLASTTIESIAAQKKIFSHDISKLRKMVPRSISRDIKTELINLENTLGKHGIIDPVRIRYTVEALAIRKEETIAEHYTRTGYTGLLSDERLREIHELAIKVTNIARNRLQKMNGKIMFGGVDLDKLGAILKLPPRKR